MKENRILAIDPGTREIGVAVIDDAELIYYGVKTIRTRETAQSIYSGARQLIRKLASTYEPNFFAIKQPLIVQQSAEMLANAIREIKQAAQQEGLAIYQYAPKTMRQFICGNNLATKREMARLIASRYPELGGYIERSSKWEELYYGKMFDAVAAGLACYYDLTEKRFDSRNNHI